MTDKTFKLGGVTVTPGSKVEPQASTAPTVSLAELVERNRKAAGSEEAYEAWKQREREKNQQALAQATAVLSIGERERLLAQATGQATVRDMAAQLDPARQLRDSLKQAMPTARDMMLEALNREAELLAQVTGVISVRDMAAQLDPIRLFREWAEQERRRWPELLEQQQAQNRAYLILDESDETNAEAWLSANRDSLSLKDLRRILLAAREKGASDFAESIAERNRQNAQQPRPKNRNGLRASIKQLMNARKRDGMELKPFMNQWEANPKQGALVLRVQGDDYIIEDEDTGEERAYKLTTLKKMWSEPTN